jgi:hypothetical protein
MLNFKEVYNYSIDGVYNISQLCYNCGELTNWKIVEKPEKPHGFPLEKWSANGGVP